MGLEQKGLSFNSEPYRTNKESIEKRSEVLARYAQSVEGETVRSERITPAALAHLFLFDMETARTLTKEEVEDVENFAQYAAKRLAVAEVYSPRVQAGTDRVTGQVVVRHDMIHVMVANAMNHGRSSLPAFRKAATEDEFYFDGTTHQEELMATLWGGDNSRVHFMTEFLKSYDPQKTMRNFYGDDIAKGFKARMSPEVRALKETDPLQYVLEVYENYYFAENEVLSRISPAGRKKLRATQASLRRHRDPEYVRVVENLYNNSLLENPDPKILLNEFRRILAPLLTRLRSRPGI